MSYRIIQQYCSLIPWAYHRPRWVGSRQAGMATRVIGEGGGEKYSHLNLEARLAMWCFVEWLQICMTKCKLDQLFWQSLHYWCLRITIGKDGAYVFFHTLLFRLSDLETKKYRTVVLATHCAIIQIVFFLSLFVNVHVCHVHHFSGHSFPITTFKQACSFINQGAQETGINELTKELRSKKFWYVVSKKEQKSP